MSRVLDALRGMVGLVQLVQERYPDFPVDNHRVIEAISALNEASITRPEATSAFITYDHGQICFALETLSDLALLHLQEMVAKEIPTRHELSLTPSPQQLRTRENEARECLAIARNYAGSWLSPTADEIVTALERRVNEHAGNVLQSPPAHNLYREGDPGAPDSIKDRNGEIVLGLCKRCGRGEAELTEPCSQPQHCEGKQ